MDKIDPNSEAVVLVGGGFAGLATAFSLSRSINPPKIILIEPKEKFVFLPLLYELLSGEINSWEVALSYHSLLEGNGIIFIQDYVTLVDTNKKQVITSSGLHIEYSKVVLCTGSKANNLCVEGGSEYTFTFNSMTDVCLLNELINDLNTSNDTSNNLVIVGAGLAGAELACKVSDLLGDTTRLHLIERGDKALPEGKAFNQEQTAKALSIRNIRVHLCTEVIKITSDMILLQTLNEHEATQFQLSHHGVIWTAGTKASFPEISPKPYLSDEKIRIDGNLKAIGYEDVFAIGDVSCNEEMPYPANAQLAMQQGEFVANSLIFSGIGFNTKSFTFNDLGEMLSLGIGNASITALGLTISGSMAFQIRRMIYLIKMPTFAVRFRSFGAWLLRNAEKCY